MTIGESIQQARKKAGLSQRDLGLKLGVSGSMIGQYENNLRCPKAETIRKIAEALNTDTLEITRHARDYPLLFTIPILDQLTADEKSEVQGVMDVLRRDEQDPQKLRQYEQRLASDALRERPLRECSDAREKADLAIIEAFKNVSDHDIREWSIDILDHMNRSGRIEMLQILESLSENPRYREPSEAPRNGSESPAEGKK